MSSIDAKYWCFPWVNLSFHIQNGRPLGSQITAVKPRIWESRYETSRCLCNCSLSTRSHLPKCDWRSYSFGAKVDLFTFKMGDLWKVKSLKWQLEFESLDMRHQGVYANALSVREVIRQSGIGGIVLAPKLMMLMPRWNIDIWRQSFVEAGSFWSKWFFGIHIFWQRYLAWWTEANQRPPILPILHTGSTFFHFYFVTVFLFLFWVFETCSDRILSVSFEVIYFILFHLFLFFFFLFLFLGKEWGLKLS